MERVRTVAKASQARLGFQRNFSVRTRWTSFSISVQVAMVSSLMAFSMARVGVLPCLAKWRPETQIFVLRTTIKPAESFRRGLQHGLRG